MDEQLMVLGETRYCGDCATSTVFLPVEQHAWVCTTCDAAVEFTVPVDDRSRAA
jgi:hypothetical protein